MVATSMKMAPLPCTENDGNGTIEKMFYIRTSMDGNEPSKSFKWMILFDEFYFQAFAETRNKGTLIN